ncbi:MAG: serine/threonine protein kinase [Candidatus Saganbacteria bacterium]|nr:serine/threonine protein kinase [Candidatus Saganbacteria bacterium]
METVWKNLTPENIFGAVETTLGEKLSNICLKRNSYINRVYELERHGSGERLIVKFYRPGRWAAAQIAEEQRFLRELAADELPVIPPLAVNGETLFGWGEISYALFPKKGGRAVDEFDKEGWQTLGRTVARIHRAGERHKTSTRMYWRPAVAAGQHLELILRSGFILPEFKAALAKAAELFIHKADPMFAEDKFILLHGDCHKGNIIFRPNEGYFVVDFDDMCFGPPVQDLWLLLPDTLERSANELNWFVAGYETFRPFDYEALELIPALRGMRIIHYAAWLAVQSGEPDFLNNFPQAGSPRYWNTLIKELQQIVYGELGREAAASED